MKRTFLLPDRAFDPTHEAYSFIAQLALESTIPAPQIAVIQSMLATHPPLRIITALNVAVLEHAESGSPYPLLGADEASFQMLLDGLRHLAQISGFTPILAAA
jgi:hypothetical protein